MAYFEGEIPVVSSGCGNNGGMWGGDGIWAILLLALLGNGGFGGGFGRGGVTPAGTEALGYELGKVATTNDVASGFNNSAVLSNLNDIKLSNASGFAGVQQTLCQGFNGINTSILTSFHGVDNAICTLGYQNQQGFNSIAHQISDCCCGLGRQIDGINYNMAKNTCDIVTAINASNQRIIDYMTSEKIDTLNRKLAVAENQISNYNQTNAIISALKPCPSPAYVVPNPNCCYPTGCTNVQ
jgi:hypothetical protein